MAQYIGNKFGEDDAAKLVEMEKRADPNNKEHQTLLEEMRTHVKKLEKLREHEDPRLSFSTPEFKEAQRLFTDNFKKNWGRPVEWAFVKEYPWSTPVLQRISPASDTSNNNK